VLELVELVVDELVEDEVELEVLDVEVVVISAQQAVQLACAVSIT
jgi:hypothetical protein